MPNVRPKVQVLVVGILIVMSLALTALLGEAVVRYRERNRETVPGTMPLLFYPHSRLRHALVRDFEYFGWARVNRQGFRGPDVSAVPDPGTIRVMVVGSSTTFDPQVTNDSLTWPARLQSWLRKAGGGHTVEVINAGVPGYKVLDNLLRLQTELHEYRPALIILYEGHNDLISALSREARDENGSELLPRPGAMPRITPWGYWVRTHSLLYGKVVGRLRAIRFRRPRPKVESRDFAALDSLVIPFTRDLHAFLAVAKSMNVPVVLPLLVQVAGEDTSSPITLEARRSWANGAPFASAERVRQLYSTFNRAIRAIGDRHSVLVIPTGPFELTGPRWYAEGDPIHFNNAGADRMAEKMAQALSASGMILPQPPGPGALP